MSLEIAFSEAAADVLSRTSEFLAADAVIHNVILSLLHERVGSTQPGRYWIASDSGKTVGVVFQSPLTFPVNLSMMPIEAVPLFARAISSTGIMLSGARGDPTLVARFAGEWAELRGCAAKPLKAQRIHVLERAPERVSVTGTLRQGQEEDRALLVQWMKAFQVCIGDDANHAEPIVRARLPEGRFWLWDDGAVRSLVCVSLPVAGVVRIQCVFTPPEYRNNGFASACVANVSDGLIRDGLRCTLTTDLANPTANCVYRRLGYRAICETVIYSFE